VEKNEREKAKTRKNRFIELDYREIVVKIWSWAAGNLEEKNKERTYNRPDCPSLSFSLSSSVFVITNWFQSYKVMLWLMYLFC